MINFLTLYRDAVHLILAALPARDQLSVRCTCRGLRDKVNSHMALWDSIVPYTSPSRACRRSGRFNRARLARAVGALHYVAALAIKGNEYYAAACLRGDNASRLYILGWRRAFMGTGDTRFVPPVRVPPVRLVSPRPRKRGRLRGDACY